METFSGTLSNNSDNFETILNNLASFSDSLAALPLASMAVTILQAQLKLLTIC
jgi:ABC-type transporter Mla subunit MlaD